MKTGFLLPIFFLSIAVAHAQPSSRELMNQFVIRLREMDSFAKLNPKDTVYACCSGSIAFMEAYTGIEAKANGTTFGKLWFTKSELFKWRKWFLTNYKRLSQQSD